MATRFHQIPVRELLHVVLQLLAGRRYLSRRGSSDFQVVRIVTQVINHFQDFDGRSFSSISFENHMNMMAFRRTDIARSQTHANIWKRLDHVPFADLTLHLRSSHSEPASCIHVPYCASALTCKAILCAVKTMQKIIFPFVNSK